MPVIEEFLKANSRKLLKLKEDDAFLIGQELPLEVQAETQEK